MTSDKSATWVAAQLLSDLSDWETMRPHPTLQIAELAHNMACREEDSLGDTSTLADPSVVQTLLSLRGK